MNDIQEKTFRLLLWNTVNKILTETFLKITSSTISPFSPVHPHWMKKKIHQKFTYFRRLSEGVFRVTCGFSEGIFWYLFNRAINFFGTYLRAWIQWVRARSTTGCWMVGKVPNEIETSVAKYIWIGTVVRNFAIWVQCGLQIFELPSVRRSAQAQPSKSRIKNVCGRTNLRPNFGTQKRVSSIFLQ